MKGTMWCSHSEAKGMSRTMTISSWSAAKVISRCRRVLLEPGEQFLVHAGHPAGVFRRPSRSGSSPRAARISRTAASIRFVSTLIVPSPLHSSTNPWAG